MDLYIAHLPWLCFYCVMDRHVNAGPGERVTFKQQVKMAGGGPGAGEGS